MIKRICPAMIIVLLAAAICYGQNKNFDLLKHKFFGELKGKLIKTFDETVQFKRSDTGLIYNYEKKNIDYVILSTGEWISFNRDEKVFVSNVFGGWGFFHLSAGAVNNLKPSENSQIQKYGISFNADLNYEVNNFYSVGFLIGYDANKMNGSKFLEISGIKNATAAGGEKYQLKTGIINRFWLFNSSFISPVISIFGGYENLEVSDINLNTAGVESTINGFTKDGFLFSGGLGLKFSTGEKSGFLLTGDYNWFFIKNERAEYLTFHIGYILPIN